MKVGMVMLEEFQSTLLMRGATIVHTGLAFEIPISIHAPHARSDYKSRRHFDGFHISIHAPHARSDLI